MNVCVCVCVTCLHGWADSLYVVDLLAPSLLPQTVGAVLAPVLANENVLKVTNNGPAL